ncbi:TIGR02117 family protein [Luteibacter aegosomaticola]|uniref:TIGR02117 family protein n=1 Tax=Luteibacter aegosomaticola TaxID=2911538 RepID=UPI001FF82B37|nr:TIGR02117 family protein [Luteibacter aegosomaticola]UPG89233.1 TIGR02117 family protein [Luteibacter aegosomaticola]
MTRLRRPIRALLWVVTVVVALPVLYLVAAFVFGLVPVNRQWQPASGGEGVTVWLTTNGVHAGFALPVQDAAMDWTALFPLEHARSPRPLRPTDVVYLGWGDRTFLLNVPTWSDLKASTAVYALSGLDGTAMHVAYGAPPMEGPQARRLVLTREAYQRLVAYIRASTAVDDHGHARWIPGHAYSDDDAFYEGTGHYSLFITCNQWTRNALSASGVRTAAWSPFDKPLFYQLPNTVL